MLWSLEYRDVLACNEPEHDISDDASNTVGETLAFLWTLMNNL